MPEAASVRSPPPPALQAFKADVVVAPYEAVSGENGLLSAVAWNLVVVDERKRMRSALAKAHQSIGELETKHRLLLSHGHPSQVGPPPPRFRMRL